MTVGRVRLLRSFLPPWRRSHKMGRFNEALAFARGELKPSRLYVPAELDVKAIRSKLTLSQDDFAACFGFTVGHQVVPPGGSDASVTIGLFSRASTTTITSNATALSIPSSASWLG